MISEHYCCCMMIFAQLKKEKIEREINDIQTFQWGLKYYWIKFGTMHILIWYHKFYSSANYMVSSLIITKQCKPFLFSVVVVLEEGCFASLVNNILCNQMCSFVFFYVFPFFY